MRKRLRKKKRIGEFQELGVELDICLRTGVDFDRFLADFLCDAVEANGLAFGGGGQGDRLGGFLELGRREFYQSKLAAVRDWLAAEKRIDTATFSEPDDAWYLG